MCDHVGHTPLLLYYHMRAHTSRLLCVLKDIICPRFDANMA